MSGTLTMMLLGAGIGGGIWLVLAGLRPRPVPLWLQIGNPLDILGYPLPW